MKKFIVTNMKLSTQRSGRKQENKKQKTLSAGQFKKIMAACKKQLREADSECDHNYEVFALRCVQEFFGYCGEPAKNATDAIGKSADRVFQNVTVPKLLKKLEDNRSKQNMN